MEFHFHFHLYGIVQKIFQKKREFTINSQNLPTCNPLGKAVSFHPMGRRVSITLMMLAVAGTVVGCNVPLSLNLYTVDANSGQAIAGVRVVQTDKHWSNSTLGVTDTKGHLDGIHLERNDRLMLTRDGFDPVRVLIDYQEAKPLQPVAPAAGNEAAHKADVPVADGEPFPYGSDHSLTILMHPR
jgi:hypothetical protein